MLDTSVNYYANEKNERLSLISLFSRSVVLDSVTPWTAACQASLSITNSQSLLKLMSIESVMPSNHLILCCSLLLLPSIFPSVRVFSMSQLFASGGQSTGVSASISVLPMRIQDGFPLGVTSWISQERNLTYAVNVEKSSLRRDVLLHTIELIQMKPFICNECGKGSP